MSEEEKALQRWRETLFNAPFVIEGIMAVWDDGYEQQGLYIDERPLSEWLLKEADRTKPNGSLAYEHNFPIGRVRVTITFEGVEEDA